MIRTRDYTVTFDNVAVSAVQDLIALYGTSAAGGVFQGMHVGQVTGTGIVMLRWSIKRLPATVTAGSGGSSATPRPALSADAAATVTSRINDTTQATTSGTAQTLAGDVLNVVNGTGPFWLIRSDFSFKASEALVLSLNTAPSPSLNFTGTAYFGEPY